METGDALVKLGGAGDILTVTEDPLVDARLYLDRHMVPSRWLPNGCMSTSGSLVNWFQPELADGRSLDVLDAEADQAGPGADGLICLPYFLGEKSPIHDPLARGAFVGLHLGHQRGYLFRACLEAVGYGFRHHLDVFRELGMVPTAVRVTNGGAGSRLWKQVVADVCGIELRSVLDHPGASLGTALAAAVGTGALEGWHEAERFVRLGEPIEPDPLASGATDEGYAVYRSLWPLLADASHRLAAGGADRWGGEDVMQTGIDLSGQVALVTGAGRGIGRGIALRLAHEGADVAINDIDPEAADRTAAAVAAGGRRSLGVAGDVSDGRHVDRMVTTVLERLGRIDILVNNAGISLYRPILDCTEEDWDRHVDIMAKGTFLCMRRVAPVMLEQRYGRIVNLGSYVAQMNCVTKYFGPYCAAKFAVVGLTQVAAQEWAPHVLVNAVGPGDVETDMMEAEWVQEAERRAITPADVKEEYRRRLLLGELEQPDDIAKAVAFLCSSYAAQVTGTHLIVGGGLPFTA